MVLTVAERRVSDVVIVDLKGRVLIDSTHPALDAVRKLLDQGERHILLNYEGVEFIDSAGIGEIVSCVAAANNVGASLKLLKPSPQLCQLLLRGQLAHYLDWLHNEDEAIASFQ